MKRIFRRHPLLWALAGMDLVFLALNVAFRLSRTFAEAFTSTVGSAVRYLLAKSTGWFSFSLFEIVLYSAILYGLYLLFFFFRALFSRVRRGRAPRGTARRFWAVIVTGSLVFGLFTFTLSPSYHRKSVEDLMGLDTAVTDDRVFAAFEALIRTSADAVPSLTLNEKGESVWEGDFSRRRDTVKRAADAFGKKYDFYPADGAAPKALLISPLMTYTHLSGVYGFYTGEANVNVNFSDFVVCFTMAHEMSHARGFAPENECNFLAFAILYSSDDAYLRYAACLYFIGNFSSACKKIDREKWNGLAARIDPQVRVDLAAYRAFMEPYNDNTAARVATAANNAYLRSNGQEQGVVSYSDIIRLCTAYLT